MKTRETRQCEMLGRVVGFGKEYGHLFPKASAAGDTFKEVAAAVKDIRAHSVSRMGTEKAGRGTLLAARKALHDRLSAMADIARGIREASPAPMPELEHKFELPFQPNDDELLTAGGLFVQDAEAFRKQFVAHTLPTTFIADLEELVEAFAGAIAERTAEQSANTVAKSAIDRKLTRALATVRKLDAMVRATIAESDPVMAAWDKARRVQYRNRVKAASPASAPEPSASPTPGPVATQPPVTVTPAAPAPVPVATTPPAPADLDAGVPIGPALPAKVA